jgi:hypothetical protein
MALDFGYNALRNGGAIPLYVKGLFVSTHEKIKITARDRYVFFRKILKHSFYVVPSRFFGEEEWRVLYA